MDKITTITEKNNAIVTKRTVRATFDRNSFHPAEGLFRKIFADLLHSYYSGRDRYIQTFTRPEIFYYGAITVVILSL